MQRLTLLTILFAAVLAVCQCSILGAGDKSLESMIKNNDLNVYDRVRSMLESSSKFFESIKLSLGGSSSRPSYPAICPQFYTLSENICKLNKDAPTLADPMVDYPDKCPSGYNLKSGFCTKGSKKIKPVCPDYAMPMDGMCYCCHENLSVDKIEGHCRFHKTAKPNCLDGHEMKMDLKKGLTCYS